MAVAPKGQSHPRTGSDKEKRSEDRERSRIVARCLAAERLTPKATDGHAPRIAYSHSIVPGGFDVTS